MVFGEPFVSIDKVVASKETFCGGEGGRMDRLENFILFLGMSL